VIVTTTTGEPEMKSHRLLAVMALTALFTVPTTVSADRRVDTGPGLEVLASPVTIAPATFTRSWRIDSRRVFGDGQWHRHDSTRFDRKKRHRGRGHAYGHDRDLKRGHGRHRIHTRHRVVRWPQPVKRHSTRHRDHPDFSPHRWW
jgi:hypothetical protein